MRPLLHPSVEQLAVEPILYALADPVRAAIYAEIASGECTRSCSTFTHVSQRTIPKSTLSQHFKVLREAGLIRGERRGVEVHNTSRCAEIDGRFPGLIPAILQAYSSQSTQQARVRKASRRRAAA